MATEVYVTVRISRLWLLALRVACAITAQGVRAVNWLADHPRMVIR